MAAITLYSSPYFPLSWFPVWLLASGFCLFSSLNLLALFCPFCVTFYAVLTLSRPGGTLCPLTKSQHIFTTAWSLELLHCDFSVYVFSIKKSSVPPISHHVCCPGSHKAFRLNFENSNLHGFSSFPPERNFL